MELKTLCETQGASGFEEPMRRLVLEACRAAAGDENVALDRMGNVLVSRPGARPDAPHVLLCAHMDEVGLMTVSAQEDGLLRVRALGGVDARVLVSKRVQVGYGEKKLPGVIGATAIHLQSREARKKALPISELYVDIGAKDKAEAERLAPAGTPVTFDTPFTPFGSGMVAARALDDRVGVYNLLRLLNVRTAARVTFAFTCQEEVGCRGAQGMAYRAQPDTALVLEGTTANDVGDVPQTARVCACGQGVVLSVMDNASIADPALFKALWQLAEEGKIAHQVKQAVAGGNEGGAVQRAAAGAHTCVLSVPCRYIHSPATVCALGDIDAQYELAKAYLEAIV